MLNLRDSIESKEENDMFSSRNIFDIGTGISLYKSNERKPHKQWGLMELENIDSYVKGKNLRVVISSEDMYSFKMQCATSSKSTVRYMVEEEVNFYFKNNAQILFDYNLISTTKNNMTLLVNCINTNKVSIIEKYFSVCKSMEVIPFQLIILKFLRKKIKHKDYLLLCCIEEEIYVLVVIKNNILMSNLVNKEVLLNTENYLNSQKELFYENFKDLNIELPKNIYGINIENKYLNFSSEYTFIKNFMLKKGELLYVS